MNLILKKSGKECYFILTGSDDNQTYITSISLKELLDYINGNDENNVSLNMNLVVNIK